MRAARPPARRLRHCLARSPTRQGTCRVWGFRCGRPKVYLVTWQYAPTLPPPHVRLHAFFPQETLRLVQEAKAW